ncbi:MAG: hypothetical protein OEY52_00280 [Gammaproteobacteria bacterium]|nr:hypothetical protein [Gammaproteobacteria bacterium]
MGVTIHFEGQLQDEENYKKLIENVHEFAAEYGLETTDIDEENKTLSRVKDEKDWDYTGPVKGIRVKIHDNCDPLIFEFDENLYMQEYIKTQFVGPEAHIIICEYLASVMPFFKEFNIFDEGEYFETKDKNKLEHHIDTVDSLIEEKLNENPNLSGPVRSPEGRILDLVSNE